MDSLMLRRRAILSAKGDELYPIGTDIITKYIGRNENNYANFNTGYDINIRGEYVEGTNAASPTYMLIDPNYRYQKTRVTSNTIAGRLIRLAYYDKDYNFISSVSYNNLNVVDLPAPPSNAKYARMCTLTVVNNWTIAIVRIS